MPCQDVSCLSLEGGFAAAVVSDGAGSAKHSEHGAAGAVDVAVQILQKTAPWTDSTDVWGQILAACREEISKQARELGCPINELAATLAFVAVSGDSFIAGNLGDGVVAASRSDGLEVLIEPARGEFANETKFLTSSDAGEHLRFIKKSLDAYSGFAIMSDGAADSLYQRRQGTLAPALSKILSWLEEQTSATVTDAIQESVMPLLTSRTRDDCSLAVLRRVCVNIDALSEKSAAFQRELLGTGNTRGLQNRLAVLEGYWQGEQAHAMSEATGLSERTVRRHRRAIEALLI